MPPTADVSSSSVNTVQQPVTVPGRLPHPPQPTTYIIVSTTVPLSSLYTEALNSLVVYFLQR